MRATNLIFDVGCHRGDDTAYYLAKGFQVVAIEANPVLYRACLARFPDAIADGSLRLLHACVSDRREPVRFFVNANDGWSSFVEPIGTRGDNYEILELDTVPLDELITEYGAPVFMKVDVEGAENRLLRALTRCEHQAAVIAIEVDFYEADPVADLERLGYDRFHILRQPHLVADPALPSWAFTRCSSGPLTAQLLADAVPASVARAAFDALRGESYRWHDLYAARAGDPLLEGWPDVHARRGTHD